MTARDIGASGPVGMRSTYFRHGELATIRFMGKQTYVANTQNFIHIKKYLRGNLKFCRGYLLAQRWCLHAMKSL